MKLHEISRVIPIGASLFSLPFAGLMSRQVAKLFVDFYRSHPTFEGLDAYPLPVLTQLLVVGQATSLGVLLAVFGATLVSLLVGALLPFKVSDPALRATGFIWLMSVVHGLAFTLVGSTLIAGMMPLISGVIIHASPA